MKINRAAIGLALLAILISTAALVVNYGNLRAVEARAAARLEIR